MLTLGGCGLASLESPVLEAKVELLCASRCSWEALEDHLGVGVDDAVEGQACSLDWVLVHFLCFLILYFVTDLI